MTWHVTRSPHTLELILTLPTEGQLARLDLIDALEVDPCTVTDAYGVDNKVTRQAGFGDNGLAVMLVNPITERIAILNLIWTG